jgi:hypothetical protein
VWDEPRPPGAPARTWWDWALVAALLPAAVLEGLLRPGIPFRAAALIATLALVPTLLWRRSRPLLMVTVGFVTCGLVGALLTGGNPPKMNTLAFLLLLPYSLARWGSGREIVIGSTVMFGKICLAPAGRRSRTALAAAAEGLRHLELGHARGKLVVTVA